MRELNPSIGTESDTENWSELHKEVVESAYQVIKLKGYTSNINALYTCGNKIKRLFNFFLGWAIGLSVASLAQSVFRNSSQVHAVSTLINGLHGIDKDVFLSVPCILNGNGITSCVKQVLTEEEISKLRASAELMNEVQKGIHF